MSNLGKKALIGLAVPLAKYLSKLATKTASSLLDQPKRKLSGQRAVRTIKWFTLFILNDDTDDIFKIKE